MNKRQMVQEIEKEIKQVTEMKDWAFNRYVQSIGVVSKKQTNKYYDDYNRWIAEVVCLESLAHKLGIKGKA